MYSLARSFLFALDAEQAHEASLKAIRAAHCSGLTALLARPPAPLPVEVFGLRFPNPVGLAAGLDKNGDYFDALAALGFGFVEIGTVTPKPQPGNSKPRLFRLPESEAVINRLGFNNHGVEHLANRVARSNFQGVLGINIGKNQSTPNENAADDYLAGLMRVYPLASYITINISSPNTKGLRDLQREDALYRLISTLREAQEKLAAQHSLRKPMLVKIAPDLNATEMDAIAEVLLNCRVDGVICGNTTLDRSMVMGQPHANEPGGLSGRPLFAKATAVLHEIAMRLNGRIPIIGVGGILSGDDAAQKIRAGAQLVQFYTGMIYRGPVLIAESVEAIRALGQIDTAHASR